VNIYHKTSKISVFQHTLGFIHMSIDLKWFIINNSKTSISQRLTYITFLSTVTSRQGSPLDLSLFLP